MKSALCPDDSDPFPFGKFKGKPFEDVPAHYLDWLSDQDWINQWPTVKAYIYYNRAVIDIQLSEPEEE